MNIVDGNIDVNTLIDDDEIADIIRFLKSQISILKQYRKGIQMGQKLILKDIDSNGNYTQYRSGRIMSDDSEL